MIARDGVEALDYLSGAGQYAGRDVTALPQVVFLDLKMPKMDGFEGLRRIRSDERTRSLPVVIVTSSSEERDVVECYRLGANSYVQKPVEFLQFADVMRQLVLYWLVINKNPRG